MDFGAKSPERGRKLVTPSSTENYGLFHFTKRAFYGVKAYDQTDFKNRLLFILQYLCNVQRNSGYRYSFAIWEAIEKQQYQFYITHKLK
jgi:hypothetical protein